jgi:hypothetical protein
MSKYFSSTQTSDSLPYDNTTSGLTAENVKDAIDELSVGGITDHGALSD